MPATDQERLAIADQALAGLHDRLARAQANGQSLAAFAAGRQQAHERACRVLGVSGLGDDGELEAAARAAVEARSLANTTLAQTIQALEDTLDGAIVTCLWLGREHGLQAMIIPVELRRACAQLADAKRALSSTLPVALTEAEPGYEPMPMAPGGEQ